jgi:DNA-binding PucR family transcriptional regulator
LDLLDRLGATVPVRVAAVVVNRVLPELFTHDDEAVFVRLREPAAADALAGQLAGAAKGVDRRAVAEDVARVLEAAALAVALRRERATNLALLQERLMRGGARSPALVLVPELFARSHGKRAVMQVAAALAEELG